MKPHRGSNDPRLRAGPWVPYQQPGRSAEKKPPLSIDQPETPSPWKPPRRRREGWLEGCCEWGDVTAPAPESLQLRSRRKREVEEEEEEAEGSQGEAAAAAAAASSPAGPWRCTDELLRRLISCLSGISQGGDGRNVRSCGERRGD